MPRKVIPKEKERQKGGEQGEVKIWRERDRKVKKERKIDKEILRERESDKVRM